MNVTYQYPFEPSTLGGLVAVTFRVLLAFMLAGAMVAFHGRIALIVGLPILALSAVDWFRCYVSVLNGVANASFKTAYWTAFYLIMMGNIAVRFFKE